MLWATPGHINAIRGMVGVGNEKVSAQKPDMKGMGKIQEAVAIEDGEYPWKGPWGGGCAWPFDIRARAWMKRALHTSIFSRDQLL